MIDERLAGYKDGDTISIDLDEFRSVPLAPRHIYTKKLKLEVESQRKDMKDGYIRLTARGSAKSILDLQRIVETLLPQPQFYVPPAEVLEVWQTVQIVSNLWSLGVRARDWPGEEIAACLTKAKGKQIRAWFALASYYFALDTGQYQFAQRQIARAVEEASGQHWGEAYSLRTCQFEQVFIKAFLREDVSDCVTLFEGSSQPPDDSGFAFRRAEAMVLAAQNEVDAASKKIEAAKQIIYKENETIKPNIQAELDWLDLVLSNTSTGKAG